jgi:predicted membrane-bound mannosyltransferase
MTAEASAFEQPRANPLERLYTARLAVNWELVAYLAIFALAFGLRFWDLGARALHHDESIHAQWSWKLLQGDYRHNPIFHGPLYYYAQGLVFFVFGASDYTSRVSAAIFGMALAALPLLLRRRLGAVGTMAAVAFIAFSPTLVYYSRFIREDIYMAVFTLSMAVAVWRYIDEGRDRWLVVFAVAYAGSLATKEATFLTTAIFLLFLNGYVAAQLATETLRKQGYSSTWRRGVLTAAIYPYAWIAAALWPFLKGVKERAGWSELPRAGDVLIVLGTLTVPLLTPFLKEPLVHAGLFSEGRMDWTAVCYGTAANAGRDQLALGGLFTITAAAVAFVGLQWRPRTWLICAGAAAAIYMTLMTSFWTNLAGACTGPWGSLDYWISQQEVARGGQPWFYYYLLMPAYEFLPLAIVVGGIYWSTVKGNAFSRFLVVWLVGTWVVLSWAGEKMPWLNVHLALPAAILAAWTVNRAWQAWNPRPAVKEMLWPLAAVAAVAAGGLILVAFLPFSPAYNVARVGIVALAVAFIVAAVRPFGRPSVPFVVVVAVVGALVFFSLRTMILVTYERGDVPKDMLIYTQTSPEIPRLASEIHALAIATGRGYDLRIAVDSRDSFAWPWAWYLRDYRRVNYSDFSNGVPQPPPPDPNDPADTGRWDVLLVNQANVSRVNDSLGPEGLQFYGSAERYEHRWWFDERYKVALTTGPWTGQSHVGSLDVPNLVPNMKTVRSIADGILGGKWLDTFFYYWRDKDPDRGVTATRERRCQTCGSVDGFAYFPAYFDRATGKISTRPVELPKPGTDQAGRPMFGGVGSLPGQFLSPVDAEIDAAGNIYVIDSSSRRLQKFDAQGNFVAQADIRLDPRNSEEQAQPWGLVLAPDGRVVVADTFGWRMRVFDSALTPIGSFGQPPGQGEPGPFDLFGPRDAAIDPSGQLWVTDTGHDRVMVYTLTGEFVRQVGASGSGPGQFDEPVGIAISADGVVFVADMYNSRVQMLDLEGRYVGEFRVDGWGGRDPADKPYIRPLRDGRVAVSLPLRNEVRVYDRNGNLQATITGEPQALSRPYGIAETADGRLWISEGAAGRLRLFEIP